MHIIKYATQCILRVSQNHYFMFFTHFISSVGLCDNGKRDVSISAIILIQIILINDIISIMLSAKKLVLCVSRSETKLVLIMMEHFL